MGAEGLLYHSELLSKSHVFQEQVATRAKNSDR